MYKTVILAGGKGKRLAPYTAVFPKPLVPIGDRPIIEILIGQLHRQGLRDITLSVGHLAELIQAYFQSKSSGHVGLELKYSMENEPLGTAAPLKLIPDLNDTFLVANGDILTTLDFSAMIDWHRQRGAILTIAVHTRSEKVDLGVVEVDGDILTGYIEKPTNNYLVSMGAYVYQPEALDYIKSDEALDFPHLVKRLLDSGEKVAVYKSDDFWLDIGRPDDYALAIDEFERRRDEFPE